jgi:protein O-GlcNAc transferase
VGAAAGYSPAVSLQDDIARAKELRRAGRLGDAERLLRELDARNPGNAEIRGTLGVVLALQGDAHKAAKRWNEACTAYTRGLELRPDLVEGWLNLGICEKNRERLAEAERAYRRALALKPDYAEVHNNLAVVLRAAGRLEESVAHYQQALKHKPELAQAWYNLGNVQRQLGRDDDAGVSFDKAVKLRPDYAGAWNNLGNVRRLQGRLDEALACYETTLRLDPSHPEAHNNRAVILKLQKRYDEAVAEYKRAIELRPMYAEAMVNLSTALSEMGRLEEAIKYVRAALAARPDYADAHYNLGNFLKEQVRLEEAIESYRRAIKHRPAHAEALANLGMTFRAAGRLGEAIEAHREAAKLRPDEAEATVQYAEVLTEAGRTDESVPLLQALVARFPTHADAFYRLGQALVVAEKSVEAVAALARSVELDGAHAKALSALLRERRQICDWTDHDELVARLVPVADQAVNPFGMLYLCDDPAPQAAAARSWTEINAPMPLRRMPAKGGRGPDGRLRIGYLSSDLRDHPVARLVAELFELHDRKRFEVFGYSTGPDDGSAIRQRIAGSFDVFRDIRLVPHTAAAQRIEDDGIAILVDLNGLTKGNRPRILARRPAPVQVNWLGHPGTSGARFMDWCVVDRVVAPPEHAPHYTEQLVWMPHTYQVNDRKREVAEEAPTRAACGLPDGGFVFACFNQTYKITPETFSIWMRVLDRVPGSVLWLLESNEIAIGNLRREAAARGVDPARLIEAKRLPQGEHLARLRVADLLLDTLPYGAHTTASDALWVGLPVLTRLGASFAGRVAAGLLQAANLPELVTTDARSYEDLAVALATEPARLAAVHEKLAVVRQTPLYDTPGFTRALESAYERMWLLHETGQKPASFAV